MKVSEAIKKRRSIRKFDQSKQVTNDQINELLEAARWAPSAGNLQSYFIYAIRDTAIKKRLSELSKYQTFISQASVIFVFCADFKQVSYYQERGKSLYCIQDAAIAAQNMWLALTEMGLGAVWVGNIDEKEVVKVLGLPEHLRPISLLVVGHPAESPRPPKRRPIKQISKKL